MLVRLNVWLLWTVGLDIQQKFNAFYSGARRFEAGPAHHTEWEIQKMPYNPNLKQKSRPSAVKAPPTAQAAVQYNTACYTGDGIEYRYDQMNRYII